MLLNFTHRALSAWLDLHEKITGGVTYDPNTIELRGYEGMPGVRFAKELAARSISAARVDINVDIVVRRVSDKCGWAGLNHPSSGLEQALTDDAGASY